MKVCIIFALQQLFRTASFELFAEMSKSLFLRDKEVVQQQTWFFMLWQGPKSLIWLAATFRTRLAEKREEEEGREEEHRQLQSVMRFTQMQQTFLNDCF